jgi:S1-C subfamily serine protease
MHDILLTVGSDRPEPPPAPRRPHHHVPAVVFTLAVLAAAVLASVMVYSAVRGPAASVAAPTSPASSALAARVDPGLVDVTATLGYQQANSSGTGMVVTPSGRVITNNHVIEGATFITVTDVGNHRTYTAAVVGYDQGQDIAVLQLAAASGLRTVPLSTSSAVTVGETVLALGNAQGQGGTPAAATGTITAVGQSITAVPRLIETAAVRVRTVHVHRPTLDDVFLHYTGRQIRDENADRVLPARARAHMARR